MSIELIALDLDGTTLNSKGELTAVTKKTLEKAIEKNINIVVATGRCFSALPEAVLGIKGIKYVITSNGAQIRDLQAGKAIYSNCIDACAIDGIYDLLKTSNDMIEVFVDGIAYIEKDIYESVKKGLLPFRHVEYVIKTRNPKENLLEFMKENVSEIENINIFFRTQEDKANMHPMLMELKHVTITTSLDSNWEIGGETTSKAEALGELSHILGVSKEEIMAFGDSANDEKMLRSAGFPVAVSNGKDIIKEAAKYVTKSNDEDGVAWAIEEFVL